jgi:hypothetical protein
MILFSLMAAGGLKAEAAAETPPFGRGAGVNFPISCSPSAQARFNEALSGDGLVDNITYRLRPVIKAGTGGMTIAPLRVA